MKVRYRADGTPDFKGAGLVQEEYKPHNGTGFDPRGGSAGRQADINDAKKVKGRIDGTTWHHENDLETLQRINSELHDEFRHRGGISLMRGKK